MKKTFENSLKYSVTYGIEKYNLKVKFGKINLMKIFFIYLNAGKNYFTNATFFIF